MSFFILYLPLYNESTCHLSSLHKANSRHMLVLMVMHQLILSGHYYAFFLQLVTQK